MDDELSRHRFYFGSDGTIIFRFPPKRRPRRLEPNGLLRRERRFDFLISAEAKKFCASRISLSSGFGWNRRRSWHSSLEPTRPRGKIWLRFYCNDKLKQHFSFFLKMRLSWPLFLYFHLFQLTVNMFYIKVCRWLDSNRRPLVSEVTALQTECRLMLCLF